MKSYYFISGLPRSGSTLLSTILKQNPDFHADISSPIDFLIKSTIDTLSEDHNNFIVLEEQRKNIMYGIFDGYYKHIENPVVFDTSRSWSKKTNLLKSLYPYTKILCPVRNIVSILNSFELIFSKNSFHTNKIADNSDNVFSRCDDMMNRDKGIIGNSFISLQEGYAKNPEMIHFIEYDNFCKEPEKIMRGIYKFLEIPYYSHNFDNIKYSNEIFDLSCNLKDLHTINRKVEYCPQKCILPPEIVEKYKKINIEFLVKGYNSYTTGNDINYY